MYRWLLLLAGTTFLFAADDPRLALMLKAQADFTRVQLAANPDLHDTLTCIQTQASLLPVATPQEQPLVHFRKGFCTLAGALVTDNSNEFTDAAAEFQKAIEGWPGRSLHIEKGKTPEPLPSALYVLGAVARLRAGWDDGGLDRAQAELLTHVSNASCPTTDLMPGQVCRDILQTGKLWLGWMALRHDLVVGASSYFADSAGTGWLELVGGRRAFLAGNYREAAREYLQAIDLGKVEPTSLIGRMGPRPDLPGELADLGGAQLLAGNPKVAINTLDDAVKAEPSNAKAFYLRARAKELSQQTESALADYNLASRTAFAKAKELASGEAHLYRGILLFRRKDFGHAEDEFSSALNFDIPGGLRADASAWRHLAAVAGGSCQASRQNLERSLPSVSPYFPKEEARSLMVGCLSEAASKSAGARH